MLLGKRHRPPMKRTTSLSEITFDLNAEPEPSDQHTGEDDRLNQRYMARVPPKGNHRRHSCDYAEAGHFLRQCSLCKNRLVPGQDIYMYRGDGAFCSLECRQQQMTKDEWKEKCGLASKKDASNSAAGTAAVAAGGSSNAETVAAV